MASSEKVCSAGEISNESNGRSKSENIAADRRYMGFRKQNSDGNVYSGLMINGDVS